MTVRYKQEITVWNKAPGTPNHVYITDRKTLIGVVPTYGPQKGIETRFSKPYRQWSPSRRKFKELSPKEIKNLLSNQ